MSSLFESVTPTVRFAKAPTAIGVVTHGDRALLVDSGLDENLARKVVNALAAEGVQVAAVINTHAHADHIGGNEWLCKRTGCKVVAPAYEHYFVERPELEPYTLFGAPGPEALQGKFLRAQPSNVDRAILGPGTTDIEGFEVTFHELPGHSVHQMGAEVDGVLFAGDALLPESVLSKYGLMFAVDPLQARESLDRLVAQAPRHVVAYHGGVVDDVEAAARANAAVIADVEETLLALLAKAPATSEDLLVHLLDKYPPSQNSLELHALQAATVRAYLASMERAGRIQALLQERRLLWTLR